MLVSIDWLRRRFFICVCWSVSSVLKVVWLNVGSSGFGSSVAICGMDDGLWMMCIVSRLWVLVLVRLKSELLCE